MSEQLKVKVLKIDSANCLLEVKTPSEVSAILNNPIFDNDLVQGMVTKFVNDELNKNLQQSSQKPKENNWISVKDKLPEPGERVLIVWEFTPCVRETCGREYYIRMEQCIDIAILNEDRKEFVTEDMSISLNLSDVTHWMPLPELPKD